MPPQASLGARKSVDPVRIIQKNATAIGPSPDKGRAEFGRATPPRNPVQLDAPGSRPPSRAPDRPTAIRDLVFRSETRLFLIFHRVPRRAVAPSEGSVSFFHRSAESSI